MFSSVIYANLAKKKKIIRPAIVLKLKNSRTFASM